MISTLWSIRTEVLMLEECLSTVTVASLTGEVKDVGVNEVVGLASDDETEVVENASDDCCFHGVNPFFPWRSSLGVMPYALGVTISAGTVLCVSHPGWEPAMAALRWHGYISNHDSSRRRVFCMTIYVIYIVTDTFHFKKYHICSFHAYEKRTSQILLISYHLSYDANL